MKVFMVATITADGYIGRDSTHNADWSGTEDKKLFVRLTKEAGVMVMGANTAKAIGRALPGRRTIVYTRHPENLGIDGLETTDEAPAVVLARLAADGHQAVAICGGSEIYNLFMQAAVVNELYLTISPLLFGRGVPLFSTALEARLNLLESSVMTDGSVLLHYAVGSS